MMESSKSYWTDDQELLEKYVLGQLSDEERKRLDAEISDCEPCNQKLRHELEMAAGIHRYGRDSLKAKLHTRIKKKQSAQIQQFQLVGLAAAVVIIAIGVGIYKIWFNEDIIPKKTINREIVLAPHEQPTDVTQNEISQGSEAKDKKEEDNVIAEESPAKSDELESASKSIEAEKPALAKTESKVSEKKKTAKVGKDKMHDEFSSTTQSVGALSSETKKAEIYTPRIYKEQTIWLIGKVEMIPEVSSRNASRVAQQKLQSEQFLAREEGKLKQSKGRSSKQNKIVTVKRSGEEEQIVLQQRSFNELPEKRQTLLGKRNHVETLIEQSSSGSLNLTIFSDAVTQDDLENASVESVTKDSLIISMPNQRIYYRLPSELSSSTRSRR